MHNKIMQTLLERYPLLPHLKSYNGKWSYDYGVVLLGVQRLYELTGKQEYLQYIKDTIDLLIDEDGKIGGGYNLDAYNIDNVNNGKLLFLLYKETGHAKYKTAMDTLFKQLSSHPRTSEGAFWHKKIYPHQVWLDGLYMCAPFYAQYLVTFKNGEMLDDVAKQYEICYRHTLDSTTGLLRHGWDEAKAQEWCNPVTGQSAHSWGRAMGWYMLSLADVLAILPTDYQGRQGLEQIFTSCAASLKEARDPDTGIWYQVLEQGNRRGNYLEASATNMITCALAKGCLLGVLSGEWVEVVERAWQSIQKQFVFYTKEGFVNLARNCQVAGLGGDDKRDGSFVYYISEPITTNDFKGYGAFLQAAVAVGELKKTQFTDNK